MKSLRTVLVGAVVLVTGSACSQLHAPRSYDHNVTGTDVARWTTELSNWGRWGDQDELGAMNLITPETRREAARLVRRGISVSLARPADTQTAPDNSLPFSHTMLSTGADPEGQWASDNYGVSYHGYAHTHMDSLCHIFYQGKVYNGFDQSQITEAGAQRLGIQNLKEGIFTRGVLMDIPRLKGREYLELREPIYPDDLDAWERRAGLRLGPGDAVLIRTGRWARRAEKGPWDAEADGSAGLHVSCVPWLHQRDIAILGSDAASDLLPSGVDGFSHPVHLLMLNTMGVHILDNCDFEELSDTAARLQRWSFLLTAAPLHVQGGTGSPLNPLATF